MSSYFRVGGYITCFCHQKPSLASCGCLCESSPHFYVLAQVQSTPLQQTDKRRHLHRNRVREVPHLSGEPLRWPGTLPVGAGHQWVPPSLHLWISHCTVISSCTSGPCLHTAPLPYQPCKPTALIEHLLCALYCAGAWRHKDKGHSSPGASQSRMDNSE